MATEGRCNSCWLEAKWLSDSEHLIDQYGPGTSQKEIYEELMTLSRDNQCCWGERSVRSHRALHEGAA